MEVLHLLLGKMRGAEVLVLDRDRSRLRLGAFRMSAYYRNADFGIAVTTPPTRPSESVRRLYVGLQSFGA